MHASIELALGAFASVFDFVASALSQAESPNGRPPRQAVDSVAR